MTLNIQQFAIYNNINEKCKHLKAFHKKQELEKEQFNI